MIRKVGIIVVVLLFVLLGVSVMVKVFDVDVNKLGNELMLLGVMKVGNVDGSILVWIGGIILVLVGYIVGDYYLDLYFEDKVLFEIMV